MVRVVAVEGVALHSRNLRPDHPSCVSIEVREGLDEPLRMPGRQAGGVTGRGAQVGVAPGEPLAGCAGVQEVEVVRLLLAPDQPGMLAVDPQRQAVFLAGRDLAGLVEPPGAAREAHEDGRVVLHGAAGHERRQFGEDGLDLEAGHVADQVVDVRPDVAHRRRRPGLRRILPPRRLLVAGRFEAGGEPSLGVLGDDLAESA